ncbi:unnamed protein product [Penicillium salamii]|uniref:Uncharacterized protein n=1 Tax=Penicillium salamii TaxID=1612424 RepID=A0A9W4NEV8_9EURO|nr:unnamed protein product [Penicillium salamii]CAG8190162.1 unnamed protein product [Penicillium salamii]CAG8260606.1 unnamed protein product [Penicillium salamii]CAG8315042.1 unnamed protein product [Penicillium salamii]CAG8370284.1 unnamed protein product [Penicillium salamii]
MHTPEAMAGISSPVTVSRNPTERVVTDEDFWQEHSTFTADIPQNYSSSSPRYAHLDMDSFNRPPVPQEGSLLID